MGTDSLILNPTLRSVRCSLSGETRPFSSQRPLGLCDCCSPRRPLMLDYAVAPPAPRELEVGNALERYRDVLPVAVPADYAIGVGTTRAEVEPRLSEELDCEVIIKSEASNPSGSFKDRGLAVAVALGKALGARRFCLPTQGNAGVAASLFSSRLGLPPCSVWMPKSHEGSYYHRAARHFGAEITFAGANIAEAGGAMRNEYATELAAGDVVDLSTFFEPGRLEGKKTLGLEIADQFRQRLPDFVVYPTGGGTGLVGIWKAFEELRGAGHLVEARLPKLVAVQSEGCAPVVQAFESGAQQVNPVVSKGTLADGLNVPGAIMGHAILRAIRESKGFALGVSDASIREHFERLGRLGIPAGFESAATLSASRHLLGTGDVPRGSRVLLLFTSGPMAAW